ncbi:hypothetical protein ACFQ2B_17840 [Streptomyces stramineus]|uniref:Lipoprotein CseA n=1 Tax=Streptomyces stramineus TaxID=173861 RepID=A0ABN1AVK3_9ACTN
MRSLKKAASTRPALITGGTVTALAAAAGLLLAGCESGTEGVRKEGTAESQSRPTAKASRLPSAPGIPALAKVDAIKLVKSDPKVGDAVKRNLKPCVKNQYPVDVIYGQLTEGPRNDVVVNVMNCSDSVGVGSYVYRAKGDTYENVFAVEQSSVYADIDRHDLQVSREAPSDQSCCAAGQDVLTYHWSGDAFRETSRTHTDYGRVGNNSKGEPPSVGTEG